MVLDFSNIIFDSINAHTLHPQTLLRVAVTNNSKHHNFWSYAIKRLSNMRYVNPKTKQSVKCISSLKNILFTLRGFKKINQTNGYLLYVDLKKYGKLLIMQE